MSKEKDILFKGKVWKIPSFQSLEVRNFFKNLHTPCTTFSRSYFHNSWLSKVWKTWKSWKSQRIRSWSGRTWKSQGILLKEPKMLLKTMLFYTETRPCANFDNFSWQNDEVPLRCVLLIQNRLLYMHNITSAIIDSNWLNTFRYGHLKRFSNGKMQNFLWQSWILIIMEINI